jgi:hypothetical protein
MKKKSQVYYVNSYSWYSSPLVSEYRNVLRDVNRAKEPKLISNINSQLIVFPDYFKFKGKILNIYCDRYRDFAEINFHLNNVEHKFRAIISHSFMINMFTALEHHHLKAKESAVVGEFVLQNKQLHIPQNKEPYF